MENLSLQPETTMRMPSPSEEEFTRILPRLDELTVVYPVFFDIRGGNDEHRRYVVSLHVSHNGVHAVFRFSRIPVIVTTRVARTSMTGTKLRERFERIEWVSSVEVSMAFQQFRENGARIFGDQMLLMTSLDANRHISPDEIVEVVRIDDNDDDNNNTSRTICSSWPHRVLIFNHSPPHIWMDFLKYVLQKSYIDLYSIQVTTLAVADTTQYMFRVFKSGHVIAVKLFAGDVSGIDVSRYSRPRLVHIYKLFNEANKENNPMSPFLVHRAFMLTEVYSRILIL